MGETNIKITFIAHINQRKGERIAFETTGIVAYLIDFYCLPQWFSKCCYLTKNHLWNLNHIGSWSVTKTHWIRAFRDIAWILDVVVFFKFCRQFIIYFCVETNMQWVLSPWSRCKFRGTRTMESCLYIMNAWCACLISVERNRYFKITQV